MFSKSQNIFDLSGKIIIITGATGLLGKQHSEAVASFNGTPILIDLSQKKINDFAKYLNTKYKVKSLGFRVDITKEGEIKDNVAEIIKRFGKVDGLINNAANNPKIENKNDTNFSRLENFSLDLWDKDILVGLTGSFLCSKHYGFAISKNSNGGSIINISSDLGLIAPDQRLYSQEGIDFEKQNVKPVSYSVVKTGIIGLTRYLSSYWAHQNVRCNAICPGGIENGQSINFINKINSRIPLGRMAGVDEYKSTLIWMLSDYSKYLNGAIIPVDGGRTVI